jgi:K+-sensing histidine kinase KdpD
MAVDEAFFSRVGHDLRGELATILAGVHFVLRYDKALSGTSRQMLERVDGASQRLRRLLDELGHAAWAVGDERPEVPPPEPYDVGEVLRNVLGSLKPFADAKGVSLALDLPDGLGDLRGDAELIGVALGQALDFTIARSAGASVSIDARRSGDAIEIAFADRGGAMPADCAAMLGEPFAEKDAIPRAESGPRLRERLGLGLAIARGILRAQGGDLRVEPADEGLTLTCCFGSPEIAARVA